MSDLLVLLSLTLFALLTAGLVRLCEKA